jgi:hypothetical protein
LLVHSGRGGCPRFVPHFHGTRVHATPWCQVRSALLDSAPWPSARSGEHCCMPWSCGRSMRWAGGRQAGSEILYSILFTISVHHTRLAALCVRFAVSSSAPRLSHLIFSHLLPLSCCCLSVQIKHNENVSGDSRCHVLRSAESLPWNASCDAVTARFC